MLNVIMLFVLTPLAKLHVLAPVENDLTHYLKV